MNADKHASNVFHLIEETSNELSDRQVRDMMFHFLGSFQSTPRVNTDKVMEMLNSSRKTALKGSIK